MMQEKRYTSEYIFHRQTDENWSSSKAGVQPGTQMLQCFNLQISCCLADSSVRNQTVKIQFPGRIRCLRIVFLETSTLSMKLFTLAWRNHRRTEQDHSQRQQKSLSLLSLESLPEGRCLSPVNSLSQKKILCSFLRLPLPAVSRQLDYSPQRRQTCFKPPCCLIRSKDLVPTAAHHRQAATPNRVHLHPLPPPATTQSATASAGETGKGSP